MCVLVWPTGRERIRFSRQQCSDDWSTVRTCMCVKRLISQPSIGRQTGSTESVTSSSTSVINDIGEVNKLIDVWLAAQLTDQRSASQQATD
eukprot:2466284-Alexandrium_andersonii.AAC.1